MGRNRFVGKGSNQGLYVDMFSLRCLLFIKVKQQVGNWIWVSWSLRRSELEVGIISIWNLKPAKGLRSLGSGFEQRSSLRTQPCSWSGRVCRNRKCPRGGREEASSQGWGWE